MPNCTLIAENGTTWAIGGSACADLFSSSRPIERGFSRNCDRADFLGHLEYCAGWLLQVRQRPAGDVRVTRRLP